MALVNASFAVSAAATLTGAAGLLTGQAPLNVQAGGSIGPGTGAGQADKLYASGPRTLAASTAEDLDLAGVLVDAFGGAITFARIKGLLIAADPGNTNNVIVGNAAANGFVSWVGGAVHTVTVRPGGFLALYAPDAVAYAVTAATADLLHVLNGGAGTSVSYSVVIIGSSA